MTDRIKACLWFDGRAEEAAEFHAATFPDSRVTAVHRAPADYPDGRAGDVLTVEWSVMGIDFVGLNAGPAFRFTEAVSFQIFTDDQAETDRLWDALTADGGEEGRCGWLKDRFGLSWQIIPRVLTAAITGPDRAAAKRAMEAMMGMGKIDIAAIERAAAGA